MSAPQLLDAAGRRRSPATVPGFHAGRSPRNKGFRYPPDPPRVEEIVAVMREADESDHGLRLRALIVVLWRAGLRIGEAMALTEPDLDPGRGSILVRQGKGGKRREVGMDDWGFDQLYAWLDRRVEMPVGTLFCVIDGRTRGRPWTPAAARNHLRRTSAKAGVRRRFEPTPTAACPRRRDGTRGRTLKVIQRARRSLRSPRCSGTKPSDDRTVRREFAEPDAERPAERARRPPCACSGVGSPLSDSNRRPLPYHGRKGVPRGVFRA
jgi:integrase